MYSRSTLNLALVATATLMLAGCATETGQSDAAADSSRTAQVTAKRDVVEHKLVRVRQRIAFARDTIKTSAMDKGDALLQQAGKPGVRVRLVQVTLKNGVEVDRAVVKAFVARPPVKQVRLVGTHVQPKPKAQTSSSCDPNYTGACVPVASDVDCAGGSGDGPAYVEGPVTIVGSDVYGLNRDDDNIACDS